MANYVNIAINEITSAIRGVAVLLADKLQYKTAYTAIDFELDEVITKRGVLGLIAGANAIIVSIPANSPIPFLVDMTDPAYETVLPTFTPVIELLTDGDFDTATKSRPVYDVPVEKTYTDNGRSALTELSITGYPNATDGLTTQFDLILIIK